MVKTKIEIWHFPSVQHFHFQFDLDNGLIEECVERKLSQKLGPNSTSQVPITHFLFRLLVVSYLSQDHIGWTGSSEKAVLVRVFSTSV